MLWAWQQPGQLSVFELTAYCMGASGGLPVMLQVEQTLLSADKPLLNHWLLELFPLAAPFLMSVSTSLMVLLVETVCTARLCLRTPIIFSGSHAAHIYDSCTLLAWQA